MTVLSELSDDVTFTVLPPVLTPPTSVSAQEGDDVTIIVPVSPKGGEPIDVYWTRGDQQLVGERYFSSASKGAVTLTVRNAGVDDGGTYSMSARNLGGETNADVTLDVKARPGDVPAFLRRLNDLAVKVGTRTRFLVEIRSPTQVKVSWDRDGRPVDDNERFHLLHEGSFFCVDVAPVTLEDAGRWSCHAHNSEGSSICSCQLNVLVPKAYKKPHFVEELVALLTEQGTVSLECKVVGVPTPTLRWFKDNQEIKAGDVFALSANPQDPTSLGTYTCEATNCMGKGYSTSKVQVLGSSREGSLQPVESLIPKGPPPSFSQELKHLKVKMGDPLTLECRVAVPPWPKSIDWFNKEGLVEDGEHYHLMANGLGGYSVEIKTLDATDEGEWKCVATSEAGVKGITTCRLTMPFPKNYRKPRFLESLKAILTEEGLVSFECKVVGFPTPQLRWFKDGQELKPGDVYHLTGTNSLGSYCCIAKNCMGEASSTAELTVEDIQSQLNEEERLQLFTKNQPPKFIQGLKSCEAKISEQFKFTVQVSVSPEPTVCWYRDDEEVLTSERYNKICETKGFCHLAIKRLEFMDQAEWKCVATNDYGQSVTSCFLKLCIPKHYKKPRFLENLRAVLSEEGAVNLECKVIGVPQPSLKWYKDGRELKPGDIHRIISGEDGTCCLGTYTCEAYNCMGTVASSASLLGFEDRAQVKPPEPSNVPLASAAHFVRQPSLSTIQEERTSQIHDTTMEDKGEVSFSFDGKEVSVSLYETPDLTEEQALQVVEMYAEELSEHVSEHNVVELPPMRFVKETSTSGHLLMEAVVIDVSPDYYASAEEDLRTDADLEEFSIMDDHGMASPNILSPEEMPFDQITPEFLERTLAPSGIHGDSVDKFIPTKPPRKKNSNASESYYSTKDDKVGAEEDKSDSYADALGSEREKSQRDAGLLPKIEQDFDMPNIMAEEILTKNTISDVLQSDLVTNTRNKKEQIKKETSRSKSIDKGKDRSDKSSDDNSAVDKEKSTPKGQKRILNKRKSTDSEIEDDSLIEFEKRKAMDVEKELTGATTMITTKKRILKKSKSTDSEKEDDSLHEFEHRKSAEKAQRVDSVQETKEIVEKKTSEQIKPKRALRKKESSDSSGKDEDSVMEFDRLNKDTAHREDHSLKHKTESLRKRLSRRRSSDSSGKDEEMLFKNVLVQEEDLSLKQKSEHRKKGLSKRKSSDSSIKEDDLLFKKDIEKNDDNNLGQKTEIVKAELSKKRSMDSSEKDEDLSPKKITVHGEDIGLKQKPERTKKGLWKRSSTDSSEKDEDLSFRKDSTDINSRKKKKKGIKRISSTEAKEQTPETGVDVVQSSETESLDRASISVGSKGNDSLSVSMYGKNIGIDDDDHTFDTAEDSAYDRSEMTVLESLSHSLQEIQLGLAMVGETVLTESSDDPKSAKSSLSVLECLAQPISEIQRGMEYVEQQIIEEYQAGEYSPTKTGRTILETLVQPIEEFERSLAIVQQQTVLKGNDEPLLEKTNQSILDTISQPLQELHKDIALIQQQAVIETGEDSLSDVLQSLRPSLIEVEGGVQQTLNEFTSKIEDMSEATTIVQPSYAHTVEELQRGLVEMVQQQQAYINEDEVIVPITVQEIEQVENYSANFLKEIEQLELHSLNILDEYGKRLESCIKTLKDKANLNEDMEIKDILNSLSNIISPLHNLKLISSKCITSISSSVVSKEWKEESERSALRESLSRPLNIIQSSLNLFEEIAASQSDCEVRGLGLATLYKMSSPMDELQTTIKLIENLSAHTAIEFLGPPIEHVLASISSIDRQTAKKGFVENIRDEGVGLVKNIDDSVEIILNCISSIEKYSSELGQKSSTFSLLTPLKKPFEEFQNTLHLAENIIIHEDPNVSVQPQQVYQLTQEIGKPLQAIRMELSIIQHQIEVEEYSKEHYEHTNKTEERPTLIQLLEPFENVTRCITSFHESILCKPPDEPLHFRYMLFALKELNPPINELCSSLIKTEENVLQQVPSLSDPNLGLRMVTQTVHELQEAFSSIKSQTQDTSLQNEVATISHVLTPLSEPLKKVESGLIQVIEEVYEGDKQTLNINLLKTLADPFKTLQKALIETESQLKTETLPESITEELLQPIQELQRSILVIQDQVSFEYGDEPSSIESNIVTLHSLIQPMQTLSRHFLHIGKHISEESAEMSQLDHAKKLFSVASIMHKLQVKVSSMLVKQSHHYLDKKSTSHLAEFPIFQELANSLGDFERALERLVVLSDNESVDAVKIRTRLIEALQDFRIDLVDVHKQIGQAKTQLLLGERKRIDTVATEILKMLTFLSLETEQLVRGATDDVPVLENVNNTCGELHNVFSQFYQLMSELDEIKEHDIDEQIKTPVNKKEQDTSSGIYVDLGNVFVQEKDITVPVIEALASSTNELEKELVSMKQDLSSKNNEKGEPVLEAIEKAIIPVKLLQHSLDRTQLLSGTTELNTLPKTLQGIISEVINSMSEITELPISMADKSIENHLESISSAISTMSEAQKTLSSVKENVQSESVATDDERIITENLSPAQMTIVHEINSSVYYLKEQLGVIQQTSTKDLESASEFVKVSLNEIESFANSLIEMQSKLIFSQSVTSAPTIDHSRTFGEEHSVDRSLNIMKEVILKMTNHVKTGDAETKYLYERPINNLLTAVRVLENDINSKTSKPDVIILESVIKPIKQLQRVIDIDIADLKQSLQKPIEKSSEGSSLINMPEKQPSGEISVEGSLTNKDDLNQTSSKHLDSLAKASSELELLQKPIEKSSEKSSLINMPEKQPSGEISIEGSLTSKDDLKQTSSKHLDSLAKASSELELLEKPNKISSEKSSLINMPEKQPSGEISVEGSLTSEDDLNQTSSKHLDSLAKASSELELLQKPIEKSSEDSSLINMPENQPSGEISVEGSLTSKDDLNQTSSKHLDYLAKASSELELLEKPNKISSEESSLINMPEKQPSGEISVEGSLTSEVDLNQTSSKHLDSLAKASSELELLQKPIEKSSEESSLINMPEKQPSGEISIEGEVISKDDLNQTSSKHLDYLAITSSELELLQKPIEKSSEESSLINMPEKQPSGEISVEGSLTNKDDLNQTTSKHLDYLAKTSSELELLQKQVQESSEESSLMNIPVKQQSGKISVEGEVTNKDDLNQMSIKKLDYLAKASSELELGLMKIEHSILNKAQESVKASSINIDMLVQPIRELSEHMAVLEHQSQHSSTAETISDQTSLALLQTLAQPIKQIEVGVKLIQEQIVLESIGQMPQQSSVDILLAIAKPIRELRNGIALIQEQAFIMEADIESISDETKVSSLETLALPLQQLKEALSSIIEQQSLLFEPVVEQISSEEDISVLKTLAQPISELQKRLAEIETQQIMEADVEQWSIKEAVVALAKPIYELQEGIAIVEQQQVFESTVEDVSNKTNLSILKSLAKPLLEVARGIAMLSEQEVLEGIFEDSTLSDLSTLASITDASLNTGVPNIEEYVVLEGSMPMNDNLIPEGAIAEIGRIDGMKSAIIEEHNVLEVQQTLELSIVNQPVAKVVHEGCLESVSEKIEQTIFEKEDEFLLPKDEIPKFGNNVTQSVDKSTEIASIEEQHLLLAEDHKSFQETPIEEHGTVKSPTLLEVTVIQENTVLQQAQNYESLECTQKLADTSELVEQNIVQIEEQQLMSDVVGVSTDIDSETSLQGVQETAITEIAKVEEQPIIIDCQKLEMKTNNDEISKGVDTLVGVSTIEETQIYSGVESFTSSEQPELVEALQMNNLKSGIIFEEKQVFSDVGILQSDVIDSQTVLETVERNTNEVIITEEQEVLSDIQSFEISDEEKTFAHIDVSALEIAQVEAEAVEYENEKPFNDVENNLITEAVSTMETKVNEVCVFQPPVKTFINESNDDVYTTEDSVESGEDVKIENDRKLKESNDIIEILPDKAKEQMEEETECGDFQSNESRINKDELVEITLENKTRKQEDTSVEKSYKISQIEPNVEQTEKKTILGEGQEVQLSLKCGTPEEELKGKDDTLNENNIPNKIENINLSTIVTDSKATGESITPSAVKQDTILPVLKEEDCSFIKYEDVPLSVDNKKLMEIGHDRNQEEGRIFSTLELVSQMTDEVAEETEQQRKTSLKSEKEKQKIQEKKSKDGKITISEIVKMEEEKEIKVIKDQEYESGVQEKEKQTISTELKDDREDKTEIDHTKQQRDLTKNENKIIVESEKDTKLKVVLKDSIETQNTISDCKTKLVTAVDENKSNTPKLEDLMKSNKTTTEKMEENYKQVIKVEQQDTENSMFIKQSNVDSKTAYSDTEIEHSSNLMEISLKDNEWDSKERLLKNKEVEEMTLNLKEKELVEVDNEKERDTPTHNKEQLCIICEEKTDKKRELKKKMPTQIEEEEKIDDSRKVEQNSKHKKIKDKFNSQRSSEETKITEISEKEIEEEKEKELKNENETIIVAERLIIEDETKEEDKIKDAEKLKIKEMTKQEQIKLQKEREEEKEKVKETEDKEENDKIIAEEKEKEVHREKEKKNDEEQKKKKLEEQMKEGERIKETERIKKEAMKNNEKINLDRERENKAENVKETEKKNKEDRKINEGNKREEEKKKEGIKKEDELEKQEQIKIEKEAERTKEAEIINLEVKMEEETKLEMREQDVEKIKLEMETQNEKEKVKETEGKMEDALKISEEKLNELEKETEGKQEKIRNEKEEGNEKEIELKKEEEEIKEAEKIKVEKPKNKKENEKERIKEMERKQEEDSKIAEEKVIKEEKEKKRNEVKQKDRKGEEEKVRKGEEEKKRYEEEEKLKKEIKEREKEEKRKEEEEKLKKEYEENKKKVEEENKRKEEKIKKIEDEEKRKEEEEIKRKEEEKKVRNEEKEKKRKEEEEKLRKEEKQKKIKEEEEKMSKDEEEKKRNEEEEKVKKEIKKREEENKRKEEKQKKIVEEEKRKEEDEKLRKEEKEKKIKEEEEKLRKEEKEKKIKEEEEKMRKEEEEKKRKEVEEKMKKEEEEKKRNEEEENVKKEIKKREEEQKRKEEEENKRQEEEENKRQEEEENKRKVEEENKSKVEEENKIKEEKIKEKHKRKEEIKRKEEEKKVRKEEEEKKRKEDEEKLRKEEKERKINEEEEKMRKDEEEKKRNEEEEKAKKEIKKREEENKRKEEKQKKIVEEEKRKEEEEKLRKEEKENKIKEEEEKLRKEEKEKKIKEEEEKMRKEEEEKKRKEVEEKMKKEEKEKKRNEEEEKVKKEIKKREEEQKRKEEEENKKKVEEENKRQEEDENKRKVEEENKRKEEEENKRKVEEENKIKEEKIKEKQKRKEEIKRKEEEKKVRKEEEEKKRKEEEEKLRKEEKEKKINEEEEKMRKDEEEKKRNEEEEEKVKKEIKKKEEENKRKEEKQKKIVEEEKRKEEEEKVRKEEEETKRKEIEEKVRKEEEEKKRCEEEEKVKKEIKEREEENKRKVEEENKRKEEEENKRKVEEDNKIKEEKIEEEQKRKDENQRKVEKMRKEEEEKKIKEENKRKEEEENKRNEEKKIKEEEVKKLVEEQKRKEHAENLRKAEEEKKIEEEQKRIEKEEKEIKNKEKRRKEKKIEEDLKEKENERNKIEELKKQDENKIEGDRIREEGLLIETEKIKMEEETKLGKEREEEILNKAAREKVDNRKIAETQNEKDKQLEVDKIKTNKSKFDDSMKTERDSDRLKEIKKEEVIQKRVINQVEEKYKQKSGSKREVYNEKTDYRISSSIENGEEENKSYDKLKKSKSCDPQHYKYDSNRVRTQLDDSKEIIGYSASSNVRYTRFSPDPTVHAMREFNRIRKDTKDKPTFCGRLVDRTTGQGCRVKLTCSITGTPDPGVEWLKDGQPIIYRASDPITSRYYMSSINGLASLEIASATLSDCGRYTCIAKNEHGQASSTCKLKVFSQFEPTPQAPIFTRPIKENYRISEDELVIDCRVRAQPAAQITWYKDNIPLRPLSRYQQTDMADGLCKLVIHGPERLDSGLYTCKAENSVWSEQVSSVITFQGRDMYQVSRSRSSDRRSRTPMSDYNLKEMRKPRFSSVLTDSLVPEGGTVALQVEIQGPTQDVTWLRGSEVLPRHSSRYRYLQEGDVHSLVLQDASSSESGTYTCRAINAYGQVDTSASVDVVSTSNLRGKSAMFVTRPETSMYIALGEDINFCFRVSGDPRPRVTWMKGVKDITNNPRTIKEMVDNYVKLTLKRASMMDAGTYFIIVKNSYGSDRAFVTVQTRTRARSLTPSIWSPPDTATILKDIHEEAQRRIANVPGPIATEPVISDAGKNWITISWTKPEHRGTAPILAYRVESWELGSEGGAMWHELGMTPSSCLDTFNLKPGGAYKFRVTARNRYGWGESVTNTEPISVGYTAFPPDITRDLPGQLKALKGRTLNLDCEIQGDPSPDIRWYVDGQEIDFALQKTDRITSSKDGTRCILTIRDLSQDDSGRYICEANNKLGRASTFARLLVVDDPKLLEADSNLKRGISEDFGSLEHAPQFTMRLRDRRVQVTYPVRLTCQISGLPAATVVWFHEGLEVLKDDRHNFIVENHFYTLDIPCATLEDSGVYTVTARNDLGSVSCHCHLVVDKGIRAYIAPEFIGPLDVTCSVKEGGELRLFAQVEAYPSVGIAWHRDGVRLRPSRRLIMTLDPEGHVELALARITQRDAGVYMCTAANAVGRTQSTCQVTVTQGPTVPVTPLPTVVSPSIPYSKEPKFLMKPRSSEAVEGDTVVIVCEVVGDPKPEVMWLRDWLKPGYYRDAPQFRIVGDGPQYSLEIPQVKLDFTGAYSVIARNTHGEAKAIISLQIYAKGQGKESSMVSGQVKHGKVHTLPEIIRELKDLRCCDGDSVTLECRVQAIPIPDIRWEKGGKLIPLGGDWIAEQEGETARLIIQKVYPEDEGEYSCVAYNDLGRAVTSACLVVDVPEKETQLNQQLSRPPGLLSAESTPRSTPRSTPSRSISPCVSKFRDFSTPPGSTRSRRVKMSSPKFYTVPHNRVAEEGETIRFQCAVSGHPIPWASWDKDGIIVTPSTRLTVKERDDLRILELREVTVEDSGLYRVTLENEMGSVEATARLDVIGRNGSRVRSVRAWSASRASPTFGRRLIGSAARVGGTFTLSCDVHASPSPITSWYRNGELVVLTDKTVPSWDGRRARLELRDLELDDAGIYTCVAENEVGTTRCSAELVVLDTTDPSDADLRPPMFLEGLQPELTLDEGLPIELQTRLQGTLPIEVVWVREGVEIPDCEDFRYVDYGDGRFGLRIADVFVADGGTYNCEAFNMHGDAITSGRLIVNETCTCEENKEEPRDSIFFTKLPTAVLSRPGGTASFCARIQCPSETNVTFSWSVDGKLVSPDTPRFKVKSEDNSSVLHLTNISTNDGGAVTCTARIICPGRSPTTLTCSAPLSIDLDHLGSPATLVRGPADTTAMRGDRVMLKATYSGCPEPSVRWLKAGRELTSGERLIIATHDGVSCLQLGAITADDSGKYVVSVENTYGADCHFASVAVEGRL